MPGDSARFHQWRYQQGELRITVEDQNLDPIAYVRFLCVYKDFRDIDELMNDLSKLKG